MAGVRIPVCLGLLGGIGRSARGPVVHVAGHEQSQLQDLRTSKNRLAQTGCGLAGFSGYKLSLHRLIFILFLKFCSDLYVQP